MGFSASLSLQDTSFLFVPPRNSVSLWVLGWLEPCGSLCIVLHLHKPTATEFYLYVFPHFRWCYYLSQWAIMIHEWTSLTGFEKKRCCSQCCSFLWTKLPKNTGLAPCTVDISGIAFIEVNIIFITLLRDCLLDKMILLLAFIYRKVFLFYAHILAYNYSNKV